MLPALGKATPPLWQHVFPHPGYILQVTEHQSHFTGWKTEVPPVQGKAAKGEEEASPGW